jgi:hypothetical protein
VSAKTKATALERRETIDPAVADLLSHMERKAEERTLSVSERKRKVKERTKAQARNRVMLDLPQEIEACIKAIAVEERCPTSQVAAILIWHGLGDLERGLFELSQFKRPSRSPRYDWNLVFPLKSEDNEF